MDPGVSLSIPDEEDEDYQDDPLRDGDGMVIGVGPDGHGEVIEPTETGRINAYKILTRQSDAPDETMWRSVAQSD
jgi:6-phosphogluconolactonase/glucosamine-6-phosphate isomerase/deaminase